MQNALIFVTLAALALAVFFIVLSYRANRRGDRLDAHLKLRDREISGLKGHVERLSPYQAIIDAQAAALAIRADAEAMRVHILQQAQAGAHQQSTEASAALARATSDAARIVEDARRNADETAADALQAVRDAKRTELAIKAMKNIIEGYGDQYIMPTAGLLDELADAFSFSDAGKQLKAARERVRAMVRQGGAADCDYAEAARRATAIDFVLDAFIGKVDMILADVRHDNVGTLGQKIRDAFAIVNHHGQAFRNARILPSFLDARLDELRWAVVAQELRLKEKEEQRQLKERIREEERAQREIEKAVKDAEKEQELLRKAMEKARRDVETASRGERTRLEQRLEELSEQLRLAEEKNRRAKSMAQQTRSGHVYVISNVGSFGDDVYKIGMTRRLEPHDRVRELGDASVPFEFDVHAMIPSNDAPALEHALHRVFVRHQINKVNPRKEFFRVSLREVRDQLERMKVEVTWSLTAAAREFRETQAMEQAIARKTFDEKAWLARQAEAEQAIEEERETIIDLAVA